MAAHGPEAHHPANGLAVGPQIHPSAPAVMSHRGPAGNLLQDEMQRHRTVWKVAKSHTRGAHTEQVPAECLGVIHTPLQLVALPP